MLFPFLCVLSEIISSPTSVNATLGSTANFSCTITTGVVAWKLNGSLLTVLNRSDIRAEQVENIFVLHIPATEEYNNTVVVCALAVLGGDNLYSDPVVLRVQGMEKVVNRHIRIVYYKACCRNFHM